MKYFFDIKEIDKTVAIDFIQERHYSKVLPRLTKHWLGCFLDDELVGVLTLGWGTQPLQTIKKLFPDFMKLKGIRRIRGKQFRYIYPLNKKAGDILKQNSTVTWDKSYPKEKDLLWKEQTDKGKYVLLGGKPDMDLSVVEVNEKNVNAHKK